LLLLATGESLDPFDKARAGAIYVRHAAETTGTLEEMDALMTRGPRSSTPPPINESRAAQ